MVKLIQWLVFGHIHKWKIIEVAPLELVHDSGFRDKMKRHILQCEHCGKLKKFDA